MTGKAARTDIKLDLASVGLGGLLKDALGKEVLSGVAKMGLNLTGTGDDWKSLARTLAGKADFALRNGAIHGFRLVPDEAQKQMKSQTQRTALEKAQKQQNFKAITASFRVKDGIVSNNDLAFMAEGLSAKGKGGLDLAAGTMDMLAYVDVTALPTIPVRAQGPLDDLSYGMDMAEFVKGTVTSIVKKPLEAGGALLQGVGSALGIAPKEKEDPKDTQKSNGGLLDAIGGMFGGSKQ